MAALRSLPVASAAGQRPLDFARDIRPILSNSCFQCHGPDEGARQAKLRLDTRDGVFGDRGGYTLIEPGKPEQSILIRRITSTNPKSKMPPPNSPRQPTPAQIETLKLWVQQGAKWGEGHWAFIAPVRPAVPTPHPVPPPQVGRGKDSLAKPPSPLVGEGRGVRGEWPRNSIDNFILARLEKEKLRPSPDADRATLVRRLSFDLLGLPPTPKEVDDFVNDKDPRAYEKLVDHLLASPHYGERLAIYWLDVVRYADSIGYHSDNPRNVSPYRDYVIRSFNENKPFDVFTIEQLAGDLLPNATLAQRVGSAYNRLLQTTEEGGAQPKEYQAKYDADRVRNTAVAWLGATMGCAECHNHKYDPFTTKDFYSFAAFFADVQEAPVGRREGGLLLATAAQDAQLKQLDETVVTLRAKENTPEFAAAQAEWEAQQAANPDAKLPAAVKAALAIAPEKRTAKQRTDLAAYFRATTPLLAAVREELTQSQKQREDLYNSIPKCLVSNPIPPREIRIKKRGNWQDESGEICGPAVPAVFKSLDVKDRRATRLDFAKWLVDKDNPLTSRVFVNRLWRLFLGAGLSRRLDDLGTQGTPPTHPELLDWLAVEFRESGWDVKHMVKLMVMSATYRQTSVASKELRARDPQNELLARQGTWRLEAEMVRDNALAIGGLLVDSVGGRSVFPYQPAGYWAYLNFPTREWQNDKGEGLYRRGVYTHWQRTFLHPSLLAFDAPTREECCAERPRSNIPQQALVLLNDPQYVEAARAFAQKIMHEGGADVTSRLSYAYRRALSRASKPDERKLLTELQRKHLATYAADQDAAKKFVTVGDAPMATDVDIAELASWTSVARVILNLHETITRR